MSKSSKMSQCTMDFNEFFRKRRKIQKNFQKNIEAVIEKYEHVEEEDTDVIDLRDMTIVEDRGQLSSKTFKVKTFGKYAGKYLHDDSDDDDGDDDDLKPDVSIIQVVNETMRMNNHDEEDEGPVEIISSESSEDEASEEFEDTMDSEAPENSRETANSVDKQRLPANQRDDDSDSSIKTIPLKITKKVPSRRVLLKNREEEYNNTDSSSLCEENLTKPLVCTCDNDAKDDNNLRINNEATENGRRVRESENIECSCSECEENYGKRLTMENEQNRKIETETESNTDVRTSKTVDNYCSCSECEENYGKELTMANEQNRKLETETENKADFRSSKTIDSYCNCSECEENRVKFSGTGIQKETSKKRVNETENNSKTSVSIKQQSATDHHPHGGMPTNGPEHINENLHQLVSENERTEVLDCSCSGCEEDEIMVCTCGTDGEDKTSCNISTEKEEYGQNKVWKTLTEKTTSGKVMKQDGKDNGLPLMVMQPVDTAEAIASPKQKMEQELPIKATVGSKQNDVSFFPEGNNLQTILDKSHDLQTSLDKSHLSKSTLSIDSYGPLLVTSTPAKPSRKKARSAADISKKGRLSPLRKRIKMDNSKLQSPNSTRDQVLDISLDSFSPSPARSVPSRKKSGNSTFLSLNKTYTVPSRNVEGPEQSFKIKTTSPKSYCKGKGQCDLRFCFECCN